MRKTIRAGRRAVGYGGVDEQNVARVGEEQPSTLGDSAAIDQPHIDQRERACTRQLENA